MREIKFRAWDKDNLRMLNVTHLDFIKRGGTKEFANLCQGWNEEYVSRVDFDLNNSELLESTGLQDRGGKEIFEGDYLEAKTGGFHRYEVRRVKGGLAINIFNDEFQKDFWTGWNAVADMQTSGFIEAYCEVIGNKFEGVK